MQAARQLTCLVMQASLPFTFQLEKKHDIHMMNIWTAKKPTHTCSSVATEISVEKSWQKQFSCS